MKAIYEQLSGQRESAFLYRQFSLPTFNAPYHFHPELELTYIKKSKGTRFVGQHIADFEAGDLVFLGENLPHCWLNTQNEGKLDPNTEGGGDVGFGMSDVGSGLPKSETPNPTSESIVIQFKADFMGTDFGSISEMSAIHELFKKAQSGIVIKGLTRDEIAYRMENMPSAPPFYQLMMLLDMLYLIATSTETELIDPQFSSHALTSVETERFQQVYAYIIENYTQEIDLEAVAAIAYLTPTAFCRYFKKITHKTFVEVVTEFRLKHACQLLTTTDKTVSDICFQSGFGNVSYFNKAFKNGVGQSPLQYRNAFFRL
jgi:AraC-like DNA-binding protein